MAGQIKTRLPETLCANIDRLRIVLQATPVMQGSTLPMSAVFRLALMRGLPAMEADYGHGNPDEFSSLAVGAKRQPRGQGTRPISFTVSEPELRRLHGISVAMTKDPRWLGAVSPTFTQVVVTTLIAGVSDLEREFLPRDLPREVFAHVDIAPVPEPLAPGKEA